MNNESMFDLKFKRKELEKYKGERLTLTACFSRFGYADDGDGATMDEVPVLLKDVKLNGEPFSDHVWILTKGEFKGVEINNLDTIQFSAKVSPYASGMPYFVWGYKLENIDDIKVIKKSTRNIADIDKIKHMVSKVRAPGTFPMISHTKGRRHKLQRRYKKYRTNLQKISDAGKVYLLLDRFDDEGNIHFKYALSPNTQAHQYKTGAVFNHFERNKVVIYETAIVDLPREEYTHLSNIYLKYYLTRVKTDKPLKLTEKEQIEIVNKFKENNI